LAFPAAVEESRDRDWSERSKQLDAGGASRHSMASPEPFQLTIDPIAVFSYQPSAISMQGRHQPEILLLTADRWRLSDNR
jgi:hypothetical protein